jgi:hypothetical protein
MHRYEFRMMFGEQKQTKRDFKSETEIVQLFLIHCDQWVNLLITKTLRRMEKWRYSSNILNFSNRWKWVVSFTPRPVYPRRRNPRSIWTLWRRENFVSAGKRTPHILSEGRDSVLSDTCLPTYRRKFVSPFSEKNTETTFSCDNSAIIYRALCCHLKFSFNCADSRTSLGKTDCTTWNWSWY